MQLPPGIIGGYMNKLLYCYQQMSETVYTTDFSSIAQTYCEVFRLLTVNKALKATVYTFCCMCYRMCNI